MRLSSGRRTPRLTPPNEAGVRRPIFLRGLKSRRICSNHQLLRELRVNVVRPWFKVDVPNEARTIHSVRGDGFILRAAS